MIVELLLARDELLTVTRRLEEAAALFVGEEVDRERREAMRLAQPARIARCDVQLQQAVGDIGVVLEVTRALRDAVAPRAMQAAVGRREWAEQELAETNGGLDTAGLRERGEHQPIPRRDRLVVAQRFLALLAQVEEALPCLLVELAAQHEAPVLERLEELLGRALPGRPGERQAFDAVRVGVLRGSEAAALERELAQDVVDRRVGDL